MGAGETRFRGSPGSDGRADVEVGWAEQGESHHFLALNISGTRRPCVHGARRPNLLLMPSLADIA